MTNTISEEISNKKRFIFPFNHPFIARNRQRRKDSKSICCNEIEGIE